MFQNEVISQCVQFADPYHCQAGSPVLQSVSCADYLDPDDHFFDSGTAKQLFDPLYEFSCEGILKGFQYYVKAAGTGESIKFKVRNESDHYFVP